MSLNNRIAIRDKCEARGPVIDLQSMASFQSSVRTGSTTNPIILEPEKPLEGCMNRPVTAEVVNGVKSESYDRHVLASLSHARAVDVTIDVV